MKIVHMTTALCATMLAMPAEAKVTDYIGSIEAIGEAGDSSVAKGVVFLDTNRNSRRDGDEAGIAGVVVSNGRETVLTGKDGGYEIPAYDDMNLFITKPADYAVPVSELMVPQFSYIRKASGSPELRFGGLEATGPLPAEINFPLIEDKVGDKFDCLVFGDTQPYSHLELGYVRATVGELLENRNTASTQCLMFEGDVLGDDLSLFPRMKEIISVGGVPQYYVAGNHDLDLDAKEDQHSFDTFRREWGPEYYSFNIGKVHFVTLDNVRYPCNGVDAHDFCGMAEKPSYNGVVHERQMTWLKNDLAHVPEDHLIVLSAHIPFQTFMDGGANKHQTDNLAEIANILNGRPVLALAGHTHTTENMPEGTSFAKWEEATGLAAAPFDLIVTGAVSGSWWTGDRNDQGIPHGTQRLGGQRGYFVLEFDGASYRDSYYAFGRPQDEQFHASFSTPRFREWAQKLISYVDLYGVPSDVLPPVTINDLGDMGLLTTEDISGGTWLAVNFWNGSPDAKVTVSIDGGPVMQAQTTQPGKGEDKNKGIDFTDPLAFAKQSTQSDMAIRSAAGDDTAGFRAGRGTQYEGVAAPFARWLLTESSMHLWKLDLPADLSEGPHDMVVTATDRHGREFTHSYAFEVVGELPQPTWQDQYFKDGE